MAKMISSRDYDYASIGELFKVDEVAPKFRMEERYEENGQVIKDKEGKPRKFETDEVVGYKFFVTVVKGRFRKKSTQVAINGLMEPPITNDEIMKRDSVKCRFVNLRESMIGHPMYFSADKIELIPESK